MKNNDPSVRCRRRRFAVPAAAVLTLTLGLAACGNDDDDEAATTTTVADQETTTTEAGGETVDITAVDYEFQGVPDSVPAGTELSFTNGSDGEVHEIVLLRINDDETRSVEELAALPESESEALFTQGPPALVSIALPGEEGMAVVGSTTLTEPGRYALFCFIPTGADPQAYRDLFAAPPSDDEGPPDIPGGPPHVTQGMFAELIVK
ncbi:MAG: hypothetical protein ACR2K0_07195 [Acidimicrobiales bacterium]